MQKGISKNNASLKNGLNNSR